MSYEFQSTLHNTSGAMCAAIAYEWMTAGGLNKPADVDALIGNATPEGLSAECVEAWDLNSEWLSERDTSAADITAAFAEFLSTRPDKA